MAPSSKRTLTRAEVALVQLKNCLVNLPRSLVAVLLNSQTTIQDVVVELQYQEKVPAARANEPKSTQQRSIYLGWTGMQSKQKTVSIVGRDGGRGGKEETAIVEIDTTFARTLGLTEYQKVGILLHSEPPLAHTVNIEPLTPGDWEIIELHASFLEINLLSQIRALPNPSFAHTFDTHAQRVHPLTLHLSPTSTANITVSALVPPQPSTIPFAKLSPNAEVIVAPKTRARSANADGIQSRSIASAGHRSTGGRSGASNAKSSGRREQIAHRPLFLRPVDRNVCLEYFADDGHDDALRVCAWIDQDVLATKPLIGADYISVSIVRPPTLEESLDTQQQQKKKDAESSDAGKPAVKVIARVMKWDDAPDSQHIALSAALCSALGANDIVGGLPIEQLQSAGFRFGGDQSLREEAAAAQIKSLFQGGDGEDRSLLDGPLTDGLVLPKTDQLSELSGWSGGLLRFGQSKDKEQSTAQSQGAQTVVWTIGSELKIQWEVGREIPNPLQFIESSQAQAHQLPFKNTNLIGVDSSIDQLFSHLSHCSSVLLTGGLGCGKSSMACFVAHQLRSSHLYYVSYLSCRKLVTDDTRVSTIKDAITRIFMAASWGARSGGKALVILDDLDKLCPVETELQVGNDNGRSRQISELLCSTVGQFCFAGSGVVLLATSESKESLNNVIIGGHVVREILSLKAPEKDARRQILQALAGKPSERQVVTIGSSSHSQSSSNGDGAAWMDGSRPESPVHSKLADNFRVDRSLDFLDIAGQTDGYMPGDLVLLLSRARSECLIRTVQGNMDTADTQITLAKEDFQQALKGFTPASLRNVTLQSSKTSFASIGAFRKPVKYFLRPFNIRQHTLQFSLNVLFAFAPDFSFMAILVAGPEILNKYIGASEKSVRDLFERAESARPCVLFFDEFDSIAPKRGHDSTGVTDRVVNQLLTQMDGAEGLSGVYVLAATSRPDLIDPALLRPGRLDKSLICDLPDLEDRLDILRALSKTLNFKPSIMASKSNRNETLLEVARRTEGYSGADLQAVVYNAHLEAIHDILDDKAKPSTTKEIMSKSSRKSRGLRTPKDLIQFHFGEDGTSVTAPPSSKQLVDNAAILTKLVDIKTAKRKERQLRHGQLASQVSKSSAEEAEKVSGQQEVVIQWKHIEASLATTRSSISAEERIRLERIYREFVVGRNGEMPRGEGPRDVGGRSSLM
ncbi:protein csx2 [Physcia stellaris]|nr:protein csx2 [Physcia stellaris]